MATEQSPSSPMIGSIFTFVGLREDKNAQKIVRELAAEL